ncbi:aldehyde dehydrogenase family protein [Acinetobacter sp. MB5]|uniref:aldehyde dehydrogenase family protein n=1 Tax=Acinetobacter sp. MB5 TaxID=2069438 RepID=UPI000DD03DEE|nr:aldehyde dehydrogenase family protein [Acinetobacter sp. MB5]
MNTSLIIDGAQVTGQGEQVAVLNPANEQVLAEVASATVEQVNLAIAAARQAFKSWKKTDDQHIQQLLLQIADKIQAEKASLAELITQEQGKPLFLAQLEVDLSVLWIQHIAQLEIPVEHYVEPTGKQVNVYNRPLGVVASITPWNWPFMIAVWHIIPALKTKNCVVNKPSEFTPLSTIRLVEIINQVVPKGVCNLVLGTGEVGKTLSEHPQVDKVVFTGSTRTGQHILQGSIASLKSVVLELGGNDVGIVLDDVDVDAVAGKIFQSAFLNAGQTCACLKRLYVHEKVYDALTEKLVEIADQQVVGDGLNANTTFGPVQNRVQYQKVKNILDDAIANGGQILNQRVTHPEQGYFIAPTLVANVKDGIALLDEEQFGPVLPIVKFSDVDAVVAKANQGEYGLGGSVWTQDLDKAQAIAEALETGTVWVNSHGDLSPSAAFGGWKLSGLGFSFGLDGLLQFTHKQSVHVTQA